MAPVNAVPSSGLETTPPPAAAGDRSRAELQKVAQEFESMLLLQVMRQVRQTVSGMGGEEQEGAIGGDVSSMVDTIDGELSRYLTQAGGFGLSQALTRSFDARAGSGPVRTDAASAVAAASPLVSAGIITADPAGNAALVINPTPSGGDEVGVGSGSLSSLRGVVTSSFGWRTDPIAHVRRFHGGVDLKAAYGQAVPSAAEGQVISAGAQGDYGLSVVVDHGNGFQTRYAHLSSIDVVPGQRVAEGAPLGRAGQSGRATGPHLHLEVLRDGQRVDPREWLDSPALKKVVARAD